MHPARPALLAVLSLAAIAARASGTRPGEASSPAPAAFASTEPREQTADQQVLHTLGRLGYRPRPGDAQRVRAMGVDAWVARQLHPERIDDRATDALVARYDLLGRRAGELARDYPPPALLRARLRRAGGDSVASAADSARLLEARRQANRIVAELSSARVARAVTSERQLQEVMADFWENHFNVFVGKNPAMRYYLVDYDRDVIRPRALG